VDAVIEGGGTGVPEERLFPKTRPDDFIRELEHVAAMLDGASAPSPISGERGLETMLVIAAAHQAAREDRTVRIDYSRGFTPGALS
jgi:predicted dehydrogenase